MTGSPRQVAILIENEFQELEFHYPRLRLIEAGHRVTVLGTGSNEYHSARGYPGSADGRVEDYSPDDFDGVVIPGGMAPDRMRRHRPMVEFVRAIDARGKVVAWICHAGWMACSADIIRGRRATSFFSIADDMKNAGCEWVDAEVVRDNNQISSREPEDLPAFCRELLAAL